MDYSPSRRFSWAIFDCLCSDNFSCSQSSRSIVTLGIDLIWDYTGILSLGHTVYFGLGAYCTAMFLKLEAVKGALPDVPDWNGLTALPSWRKPFGNGVFAIAMWMILPALLVYFTFKNRISGKIDQETGIQPNVVSQIEDAIHLLKKRGDIAVLLVEQSLDFATTVADYTYILDHGQVVLEGKPEELTPEVVKAHLTL